MRPHLKHSAVTLSKSAGSSFSPRRGVPLALGLLALLPACGEQAGWPNDSATVEAAQEQASAEQREAAAALSVANWAAPADQSEFERSIECAAALSTVAEALKGATLVSEAEIEQVQRAGKLFAGRVESLASGEGQTSVQARSGLATAQTKAKQDLGQSSRIALSCIRSLADAA